MNKSHLLINEPALQVLPSLAMLIGLDEAIVIQQLHYWLNNIKSAGRIDENGDKWVYNTYAEWRENNFPFWSEDKIQRIFLSLEAQGVIISAQLDAKKRDMRKFYRIGYPQLCAMDDSFLRPSNTADLHDVKMNQRLPENTSYIANETSKPDILDGVLHFAEVGMARGEDAAEEVLNTLERSLRLNIPRKPEWQSLAKWILKQDVSLERWLSWYLSDEFRKKTAMTLTADKIRKCWPQAQPKVVSSRTLPPEPPKHMITLAEMGIV